jgi:hypothetical protein
MAYTVLVLRKTQTNKQIILMDDNAHPHAHPHRARVLQDYLESVRIDWPARPPDLIIQ